MIYIIGCEELTLFAADLPVWDARLCVFRANPDRLHRDFPGDATEAPARVISCIKRFSVPQPRPAASIWL
jgi:hypothetical protein